MSKHAWEKKKERIMADGDVDNVFGNPWDFKNNKHTNPVTWKAGAPKDYMVEPLDLNKPASAGSKSNAK